MSSFVDGISALVEPSQEENSQEYLHYGDPWIYGIPWCPMDCERCHEYRWGLDELSENIEQWNRARDSCVQPASPAQPKKAPSPLGDFARLPDNVRIKILRFSLVADQPIDITSLRHRHVVTKEAAQPGLARTSRQLRRESLPIFYGENTFSTSFVVRPMSPTCPWPLGDCFDLAGVPNSILDDYIQKTLRLSSTELLSLYTVRKWLGKIGIENQKLLQSITVDTNSDSIGQLYDMSRVRAHETVQGRYEPVSMAVDPISEGWKLEAPLYINRLMCGYRLCPLCTDVICKVSFADHDACERATAAQGRPLTVRSDIQMQEKPKQESRFFRGGLPKF